VRERKRKNLKRMILEERWITDNGKINKKDK
jgi:hypothetical protein